MMKRLIETDTTIEERFGKCPYATAQSLISGKWAVLILHYLEDGPVRFNELQRLMPKMTPCHPVGSTEKTHRKRIGGAESSMTLSL